MSNIRRGNHVAKVKNVNDKEPRESLRPMKAKD